MRNNLNNTIIFTFASLLLCIRNTPACAADANNEVQWFVNLVTTNNGKAFCVPPTATLNEVAAAYSKFSKAHSELHDHLTDQQVIQGISESYPCTVPATPALINTGISKIGTKLENSIK